MEILFKNSYVRDEEWAKNAVFCLLFRRPVQLVCHVFAVLYLAALVFYIMFESATEFVWTFVFIFLFYVACCSISYVRNYKLCLKRDVEVHGSKIEMDSMVTDEGIIYKSSTGSECKLNFGDIKRVITTKKYIYLWSKSKLFYSFKRDGFSVGSAEEFLVFLKEKM